MKERADKFLVGDLVKISSLLTNLDNQIGIVVSAGCFPGYVSVRIPTLSGPIICAPWQVRVISCGYRI